MKPSLVPSGESLPFAASQDVPESASRGEPQSRECRAGFSAVGVVSASYSIALAPTSTETWTIAQVAEEYGAELA